MDRAVAKQLLREAAKFSKTGTFEDQAEFEFPDETNALEWLVTLTPKMGYFRGASLKFLLNFTEDYPAQPPQVHSLQAVYHPNISSPSVCFNMFSGDGFSASYSAENYINGLLWLLAK
jgi:ubiquitin-protein ligase